MKNVDGGYEIDGTRIVTSDEALDWESQPRRVAIIGGGVIGCEFASFLADVGSEVHLFEALDQLGCARRVAARCEEKRRCLLKTRLQAKEHLREVFEVEGERRLDRSLVGSYGLRDVEPELVIADGGIEEPGER